MNEIINDFKDIHSNSKEKYNYHSQKATELAALSREHELAAEKWRAIMEASTYGEGDIDLIVPMCPITLNGEVLLKSNHAATIFSNNGEPESRPNTFGYAAESILIKMDAPMLTRRVMEEYSRLVNKAVDRKEFASKMNISAKKSRLRSIKFNKNPNDSKYWWALDTWLDSNNNLKPEYRAKIEQYIVK